MKPVIYASVGLSLLGVSALAQSPSAPLRPAKAAERQAAVLSIQTQLNAFARDDYKTAITYQSAGLKKNFVSPDAFRTMMVRAYPEFAHFKSVQFGAARADTTGNHIAIPVVVTGRDGITVRALYFLVRENKTYRIEGVHGGVQAPPDRANGVSGMDV
jgi:hypothetical protein